MELFAKHVLPSLSKPGGRPEKQWELTYMTANDKRERKLTFIAFVYNIKIMTSIKVINSATRPT